jgi:hypothetical protein
MDFLHNFFASSYWMIVSENPASDARRLELLGEDSSRSKVMEELLLKRNLSKNPCTESVFVSV